MLPMMPRSPSSACDSSWIPLPDGQRGREGDEDLGIVMEMTGQKKNRSYSYQAYVELLSR